MSRPRCDCFPGDPCNHPEPTREEVERIRAEVRTMVARDAEMSEHLAHLNREVAAISEGFCPTCNGRLTPIKGVPAITGRCPLDGTWQAYSERERREGRHDTWVVWTSPETAPGPARGAS